MLNRRLILLASSISFAVVLLVVYLLDWIEGYIDFRIERIPALILLYIAIALSVGDQFKKRQSQQLFLNLLLCFLILSGISVITYTVWEGLSWSDFLTGIPAGAVFLTLISYIGFWINK